MSKADAGLLAMLTTTFMSLPISIWVSTLASVLLICLASHGAGAASWHTAGLEASSGQLIDPCLGLRWQRVSDPLHPDWPGRLLLLDSSTNTPANMATDTPAVKPIDSPGKIRLGPAAQTNPAVPVNRQAAKIAAASGSDERLVPARTRLYIIRAGDRIQVDQESERVHARFAAEALGPAAVGQLLRVRLSSPGAFGSAVGTGPDQAILGPIISVWVVAAGLAKWTSAINQPQGEWNQR